MDVKDKNILAIGLGLLLVTLSNIIGHFAGPFSIFATPIILPIIIAFVNSQLYESNFPLSVLYNYGLLLFNDLFIRFYAGGTHDQVGKAWISLFFSIAFILAFITMAIYSFTTVDKQKQNSKTKIVVTNIFVLLISTIVTGLIYYYLIAVI